MAKAKKIPQFLTEKEFHYLISCYLFNLRKRLKPVNYFSRIRNAMIWQIQFYIGLRPKEAKDILINEIDFNKKNLYIPAKNNKQRNQDNYPLTEEILNKIKSYIQIKNKFFPNSPYLFPSLANSEKPVYRGTLVRAFTIALELANFKKISYTDGFGRKKLNLSLYSLRHSFGTFAMHTLKDPKQVAKLLRHRDPQCRSTYIYTHTEQMLSTRELLEKVKFKKNNS